MLGRKYVHQGEVMMMVHHETTLARDELRLMTCGTAVANDEQMQPGTGGENEG
jgi:hypothetical protein